MGQAVVHGRVAEVVLTLLAREMTGEVINPFMPTWS